MKFKKYPISVSMTPAFFDENHMLLKAQLNCLSNQTIKDFDVYLIDPHYQKRKTVIPELAEKYKLDIKHIPYIPNTHISKLLDCSIFNAGYCYSTSQINVRYSCYRFVRPTFIETICNAPKNINVDFYYLAIGPDHEELKNHLIPSNHKRIWNFESDDINWNKIPTISQSNNFESMSLFSWNNYQQYTMDTDIIDIPVNLYGNIAWNRDQWISINGTNEVITNFSHWEDLDFVTRSKLADHKVIRRTDQMYRLYHTYGAYSQRSNVQVDVPIRDICEKCMSVRYNHSDYDYEVKLNNGIKNNNYHMYYDDHIWVCKECKLSGPVYTGEKSIDYYLSYIRSKKLINSPIIKEHLIGRNLKILSDKMDKETTIEGKFEIYNDSWKNYYYYEN